MHAQSYRSKSGQPLEPTQIADEIRRCGSTACLTREPPLLVEAKAKVQSYIERAGGPQREEYLAALDDLLPKDGSVRAGPYSLFYGAVWNHVLHLDELILECPLHLELTLLHLARCPASSAHGQDLEEERAYIRSTVLAEGKYELSKLGLTVTDHLRERSTRHKADYVALLTRLLRSEPGSPTYETCQEKIGGIVNAVNLFDRIKDHAKIDVAEISKLEEFTELDIYRPKAIEAILNGRIAFEGFYAGVGERMGGKPFYTLDPWSIVEENLKEEFAQLAGKPIPERPIPGLGMGSRQLYQLRMALEDSAGKQNWPGGEVLSRFVIILHVSPQVELDVRQDLLRRRHYGFCPQNVIFVPQPALPGWRFDPEGVLVLDPRSKLFPYNHGWARMQLNWKCQAYWLDDAGHKQPLAEPVVDQLLGRGIRYLTLNRINDLDRLSPEGILDVDLIALSLYLLQGKGYSLTVELVGNDTGEKGGFGLRETGADTMFLVESLCAKSKAFAERMEELMRKFRRTLRRRGVSPDAAAKIGVPYNAMRQVEDIEATKAALEEGLPVVLRYREGRLYLEVPTGDMTNLPGIRARAVMRMNDRFHPYVTTGELINDFKKPEHAHNALRFLQAQDHQARFRQLAAAPVTRTPANH